jgi:integrase
MPLTDAAVRAAKPQDGKLTKFGDGGGLQLWAHPSGKRSWHFDFRFDGRQRSLTLGPYPDLSLKDARRAAAAARERLAAGEDPSASPGASSAATPLFGALKDEWLRAQERNGRAAATMAKNDWLAGLAGALDARPIAAIRTPEIFDLLKPLEAAGQLETARRLRAFVSRVFRYAAAKGVVDNDPAALLRGAIASPKPVPRAAIVERQGFAALMRAIDVYQGYGDIVRDGLMLLALTAARPGELRLSTWPEFDLNGATWAVPAERMKMRRPHRAPLARQAVAILIKLKGEDGLARPSSPFVFPSHRPGRPISENAFTVALRAMGFAKEAASAHGFRSSFSTLANESGLWNFDAVERALAHQDKDETRRAYHRADYFEERKRLMQWWANEIEGMLRSDVDASPKRGLE